MRTDLAIPDPDSFYEAVLHANEGRTDCESLGFTLRLCLLLANQIGDQSVLMDAIAAAQEPSA